MYTELESTWKKASVAQFEVLSRDLSQRTEESHEKPIKIANLRADIQTPDLPDTKQNADQCISEDIPYACMRHTYMH
jgi:hypothetical protein